MISSIKQALTILLCFFSFLILGQEELSKYKTKYPDKDGVFLNNNAFAVVSVNKEGGVNIEINHEEERLFLNENYKYYTEDIISFSSFTSIKSMNPSVYIPENGKYKKVDIKNIMEEDATGGNVFHDDLKKKRFFY